MCWKSLSSVLVAFFHNHYVGTIFEFDSNFSWMKKLFLVPRYVLFWIHFLFLECTCFFNIHNYPNPTQNLLWYHFFLFIIVYLGCNYVYNVPQLSKRRFTKSIFTLVPSLRWFKFSSAIIDMRVPPSTLMIWKEF